MMNYLYRVVRGEIGLARLIFVDYLILLNFLSFFLLGSIHSLSLSVATAILLSLLRMCWIYGMWVRTWSFSWSKRLLTLWLLLPISVFEGAVFLSVTYYVMQTPISTPANTAEDKA